MTCLFSAACCSLLQRICGGALQQIKEKPCSVGYDLEVEKRLALETTTLMANYTLPDAGANLS